VKRLTLILAALAALPPLASRAATLAPGIHNFVVTATPSQFPCANPYCSGPLGGLGSALVTGLDTSSQPFTATWPDPTQPVPSANTTGSLYNLVDTCLAGGPVPSVDGSGSASLALSGGLVSEQGEQMGGASLTVYLSFFREGTDLAIFVSGATVSVNGTVIAAEASLEDGLGDGSWAVASGIPACGAPLTNPQVKMTAGYLAPD